MGNNVSSFTRALNFADVSIQTILGDPRATSRDDAMFSSESLLQELKSPWELILTEPVPEVVDFRPTGWPEKYFLPSQRGGLAG